MTDKIQFTQEGYDNLIKELSELQNIKKPKAVLRLQKARSMGDLRENSEYSAAKEELAFAEGRTREVEELIKKADIVNYKNTNSISIGKHVVLEKNGKTETFTIVGEFEANLADKKLSATSPIGRALIGKKVGNLVEVEVPAGKLLYKVLKIS